MECMTASCSKLPVNVVNLLTVALEYKNTLTYNNFRYPNSPRVEHFNVIEDIRPGHILGYIDAFPDPYFFSELKYDSATALSQQLQRRLS